MGRAVPTMAVAVATTADARPSGPRRSSGSHHPKRAVLLEKLGIRSPADAVLHLPYRYEDETRLTPIAAAPDGSPVLIEAAVQAVEVKYRPRRQLAVTVRDESGFAVLRFFSFYPSLVAALNAAQEAGHRVRAFGEVRGGFFGAEIVHPRIRVLRGAEPLPAALTPVYPSVAGLGQAVIRAWVAHGLAEADLRDSLSAAQRHRLDLWEFATALRTLHQPPPGIDALALAERRHPAWRRIKFDELLAQQLMMREHYRARRARRAPALSGAPVLSQRLMERLPFELTAAQRRVWAEIGAEIGQSHPMNRLLQGDVGSGKTIVAALAALRAVESGYQAAVMAPTEVLAAQHERKFREWLEPLGVRVVRLSGTQKRAERRAALAELQSGAAALAIGTHALFQEAVGFQRLGLAIVDEQHRFGVRQRLALREKGAGASLAADTPGREAVPGLEPHLLMMSATPIPRTLAMSHYADLDVSVIDALPPGRTPVRTKLIAEGRRAEVILRMREVCAAGEQVYWVCPLIEESEALDLQTVVAAHADLSAALPGIQVGLLHGRLPAPEKAAVIEAFVAGRIQVLVATTVVEVGVDVPNASLMVIEHAERFGLAQIHQLRGRVGRGRAASTCILLYQTPLSENGRARLKILFENTDGFRIAQADLDLRGPGELLGVRQSGVPLLRFADLATDGDLLEEARATADALLEEDPARVRMHLARWSGSAAALLTV
jgi:ATP-dependent DNA helicase RecG